MREKSTNHNPDLEAAKNAVRGLRFRTAADYQRCEGGKDSAMPESSGGEGSPWRGWRHFLGLGRKPKP